MAKNKQYRNIDNTVSLSVSHVHSHEVLSLFETCTHVYFVCGIITNTSDERFIVVISFRNWQAQRKQKLGYF